MMSPKIAIAKLFAANGLVWLVVLTAFLAVIYCSAAVYFALAPVLGSALAALLTGTGLWLLLSTPLVLYLLAQRRRPPARTPRAEPAQTQLVDRSVRPMAGDAVTDWARANTGQAMVIAAAAGIVLAASPTTRRLLARAFAPMVMRGVWQEVRKFSDR